MRHRVAILYQNDAFGAEVKQGLTNALSAVELSLVSAASFVKNTLEVEGALYTIAEGKPNAIVIAGTYEPTAEFIMKVKNATGFSFFRIQNINAINDGFISLQNQKKNRII